MKKALQIITLFLLAAGLQVTAQTVHEVEVGDDLIAIVADAADGDIILIKAGAHKASYTGILVDNKTLTFRGEDGPKPVVYIKQIDVAGEDIDIFFENLEFSGYVYDSIAGTEDHAVELRGDYLVNLTDNLISAGTISIENCIIRNIARAVIRGDRAEHTVENLLVNNTIIHDHRDSHSNNYGPFRFNSRISLSNITITNSTIYNTQKGILQCENMPAAYPKTVLIENVTMDRIGSVGRRIFDFKLAEEMVFTIKNSIIGRTNDPIPPDGEINGFRFNEEEGIQTTKILTTNVISPGFNVTNNDIASVNWSVNTFNEIMDPGFLDPDNGDFSIAEGSELLEMSTEGGIVGDPRWGPADVNSVVSPANSVIFKVYPNPAQSYLFVNTNFSGRVTIYSMIGVKVMETKLYDGVNFLDISNLKEGLYIISESSSGASIRFFKK